VAGYCYLDAWHGVFVAGRVAKAKLLIAVQCQMAQFIECQSRHIREATVLYRRIEHHRRICV
jgi:hypothetical protein